MSKLVFRSLTAAALCLVLSNSSLAAAPVSPFAELRGAAYSALSQILGGEGFARLGCTIDPNGQLCASAATVCVKSSKRKEYVAQEATPKLGGTIDPDGAPRCTP